LSDTPVRNPLADLATARAVPLSTLLQRQPPAKSEAVPTPPVPAVDARAEAEAVGYAQGHAAAEAELMARIDSLEQALAEAGAQHQAAIAESRALLQAAVDAMDAALAQELAGLTFAAAKAVLAREPRPGEVTLRSLLAEALHGLSRGTLFFAPADLECGNRIAPEGWMVEARASLTAGMVEAEVGATLLRVSLQQRLQQLLPDEAAEP